MPSRIGVMVGASVGINDGTSSSGLPGFDDRA
jgi:hypothetical protein